MSRRFRLKHRWYSNTYHSQSNSARFYADEDYQFYLESLDAYCRYENVEIHAYVLMTNHVLVTPTDGNGPFW